MGQTKPLIHSTDTAASKSCVICIGSTGTGKSSTIQKCTQRDDVMTGSGLDKIDDKCRIYRSRQEKVDDDATLHSDFFGGFLWKSYQKLLWVDTVGLNDTNLDGNYHDFIGILNRECSFKGILVPDKL